MAVTVTSHRVVPFKFLFLNVWAIEKFVEVDEVEVSKDTVSFFIDEEDALAALTNLPQYGTFTVED